VKIFMASEDEFEKEAIASYSERDTVPPRHRAPLQTHAPAPPVQLHSSSAHSATVQLFLPAGPETHQGVQDAGAISQNGYGDAVQPTRHQARYM
jgi:hypothetical protein